MKTALISLLIPCLLSPNVLAAQEESANDVLVSPVIDDGTVTLSIYAPPGYDSSNNDYPVFYLLHGGGDEDYEAQYPEFLDKADWINNNVDYFSLMVGTDDFAHSGSKLLSQTLDKHGIDHEFVETGGGHTWINWRGYLADYAPRLFR